MTSSVCPNCRLELTYCHCQPARRELVEYHCVNVECNNVRIDVPRDDVVVDLYSCPACGGYESTWNLTIHPDDVIAAAMQIVHDAPITRQQPVCKCGHVGFTHYFGDKHDKKAAGCSACDVIGAKCDGYKYAGQVVPPPPPPPGWGGYAGDDYD